MTSLLHIALQLALATGADTSKLGPLRPEIPETAADVLALQMEEAAKNHRLPPRSPEQRVGQLALSSLIPPYPHALAAPVPLGEQMDAHGMPMNIQTFETHDDPHQVMDYYRPIMESWHFPMKGNGDLIQAMPYPSLTVFDDFNGVDISVVAIPDADTRLTLVVASMSDIRTYEKHRGEIEALKYGGLPEYPHGVSPSALTSTDGDPSAPGRKMVTVLFKTPDPVDQVVSFYNAEMSKAGYQSRAQPGSDASYQAVDYSNAHQIWHLMASAGPNGEGSSVMATWQSGPDAEQAATP